MADVLEKRKPVPSQCMGDSGEEHTYPQLLPSRVIIVKANARLTLTIHEGAMPYETINSFRLVLTSKYHFFSILKGNYVIM